MKWMNEVFPDNDQWQKFSNSIVSLTESLKNSIEIGNKNITLIILSKKINNANIFLDPQLKKLSEDKLSEWRNWFDSRLDNAIEATEIENQFEGTDSEYILRN